ncbi:PKD domain-containing protein [Streptosporangium sp. NPDC049248]|uniref:PKD domain-containing protein n=1 Tax=Streptosporangium sp. NPDC049248 TaxID=3155651 RepID=UPI0034387EC6
MYSTPPWPYLSGTAIVSELSLLKLFNPASVRRIALPVIAALVGGALAMPLPALASAPTPDPKTAIADESFKITDLGSLDAHWGSWRWSVAGIDNSGRVVANLGSPSGLGISQKAIVISPDGTRTDVSTLLGNKDLPSYAEAVNSDGKVLGWYKKERRGDSPNLEFSYKDGTVKKGDKRLYGVVAVNNKEQILHAESIVDSDGSKLRLEPPDLPIFQAEGMNNKGSVVGYLNKKADIWSANAFRTKPGEPVNLERDMLYYQDWPTTAYDVNDRGEVAGWATKIEDGIPRSALPVIWDAQGKPHVQYASAGGRMFAINNSGVGVGVLFNENDQSQAALFYNGASIDLSFLSEETHFKYAVAINDHNQVVLVGYAGSEDPGVNYHLYLLDLGGNPAIESLTLETQKYPSNEWVPADSVTDGNQVRITAKVSNPSSFSLDAKLSFGHGVESGESATTPIGKAIEIKLAPKETATVSYHWSTSGIAWEKKAPKIERYLKASLKVDRSTQSFQEKSFNVLPKPVVLVHGWKSDAKSSWDSTKSILTGMHTKLKVYAVGDGAFGSDGGTLSTGNLPEPYKRTKDFSENVAELAKYVENVRTETGAFRVDVIAHSMGGLITRGYIQDGMPKTPDKRPVINRMMQMGTPNRGTPCADVIVSLYAWSPLGVPYWPATRENTTPYVQDVLNEMYVNLKDVAPSNLVGVGRPVPCTLPSVTGSTTFPDGDMIVPQWSARYYNDMPTTGTIHTLMTGSQSDFDSYVKPRLATEPGSPEDEDLLELQKEAATESDAKTTLKAGASADGGTDPVSLFATPSTSVEPGKTVAVPLEVPQGSAFGVTAVLPSTTGLLLRDPSGKAVAQYAAGSDEAKQPIQGLRVGAPQAGAWKLEVTNTAAEPVTADLGAWVAENPVQVSVVKADASDDGRVRVVAEVTDESHPVTGVPVRAVAIGKDGARHELALKDDGDSDDGAAGDGVYGARSDALPDDVYSIVVKADTAKGPRTAQSLVEVKKPDLREFELSLSAEPGGSVSASPDQATYRAGSKVKVTATPEAGRVPIGWEVDGEVRGPGALTLTMDRAHTVTARFGTFKVTELGTLPGQDPSRTEAWGLNDRGQVAGRVYGKDGKWRAVRWQDGKATELSGLACSDDAVRCETGALGINEAGDVSGSAVASVNGRNTRHAVVWSDDGSITDLQPGYSSSRSNAVAIALNDNGEVFGNAGLLDYVTWYGGAAVALPAEFDTGVGYIPETMQDSTPHINAAGAIAGAYTLSRDTNGLPRDTAPAVYADGVLTRLPGTVEGCAVTGGKASDLNNTGLVVGTLRCGSSENKTIKRAMVWKDGKPVDLGSGEANAVNDNGVIVGFEPGKFLDSNRSLVMWVDGTRYPLTDKLSRPWCPEDALKTTSPCAGMWNVRNVNSSGQILVQGFVRDRSPDGDGFVQQERSLLLTPSPARADLEVTHSVSPAEPGPGSTVTWTATVTNKGPDAATDVRLDVAVPNTAGASTCETYRGLCTPIKGGHRNTVKVLEPGWSATVKVSATVPADAADGTELQAGAHGYSLEVTDPKPDDNSATATATVRPWLDKAGILWTDPVQVGSTSQPIKATLTNRGSEPMQIKTITAEGPFGRGEHCPVELAVGAKCSVDVTFTPDKEGDAAGKLTFTTVTMPGDSDRPDTGYPEDPFPLPGAGASGTGETSGTEEAPEEEGTEVVYTMTLAGRGVLKTNAEPVVEVPAEPLKATVGKPFTLKIPFTDADAEDTHTAKVAWGDGPPVEAVVTQRPGGGTVEVTRTFTAPRTGTAMVMVYDSGGALGAAGVPYVIEEEAPNTAPVVTAGPDVEIATGKKFQRVVSFSDPGSTSWTATVDYGDGSGVTPVTVTGQEIALEHTWGATGTYPVTVTVRDDGGLSSTATFTATVVTESTPNQAPRVTVDETTYPVEAGSVWSTPGSFTDPDSTAWTYMVDYGDGAGPQPLTLTAGQIKLQHVYQSAGEYTVVLTVTDDKGAAGSAQVTVNVTNAVPEVTFEQPVTAVAVGAEVKLNATFTDPGGADVHTAVWSVGGTPVPAALAGPAKSTGKNAGKKASKSTGMVTGSHVFTKPGRYPISLTVTDNHGGRATADTVDGEQVYIEVYDPATAVAGDGSIEVPAGSCRLEGVCGKEGSATFTLSARYPGKATKPTTGLTFNAPGFKMRGTSATALVADGSTAVLRGNGKVNGTIEVTYEITAVDSGKPADRTDQLTIKVWKKKGELIYDNSGKPSPVNGVIRISG